MSGSRSAPHPFSGALGSSPEVGARPRDHPLQKTNNTLAEDFSLSQTAIVPRAKSPPAGRFPLPPRPPRPWSTVPLRPPRRWAPRASSGQAEQLDLELGRGEGREILSLSRRQRAGHAPPLPGLSRVHFPLELGPGTWEHHIVSGLEGQEIPFMGRGKGSRAPARLQQRPRWFCPGPTIQSGGLDFYLQPFRSDVCAPGHKARWCREHSYGRGAGWDKGALEFCHCPGVSDPAIALELRTGVGAGWLGAPARAPP